MSDPLTRAQKRIIAAVMSTIADDGFAIAGGAALISAGISERPTRDLDAFSASCGDVGNVAQRLSAELRADSYLVDEHLSTPSFARLTVATGRWRRSELLVELGRDVQLFDPEQSPLGPRLSVRELAANKILAAFGRHEPRDLVDLAAIAQATSLDQATTDARSKDAGFDLDVFREMIVITANRRDDLWPIGSDPIAVRAFVDDNLLNLTGEPPAT